MNAFDSARPLHGLLLASLVPHAALAGDLALHTGDPAAAVGVLGATLPDRDAASFDLRTIEVWLAGKPVTLTAGAFEGCTAPPARPWKDALAAAAVAIDDVDFEGAKPFLLEARAAIVCSAEVIDPATAARVDFLLGVVAHTGGDASAAEDAFVRALTIAPDLTWDPAFPPSMRARFEDAKKRAPVGTTSLAVVPRAVPLWIDGRAVELVNGKVDVPDGTHLVQVGGTPTTLRVTFEKTGAASLAVPSAVPPDATAWAADPALSGDLARLAALYSPGVPIYVVSGESVYAGGDGTLAFSRVIPPEKSAPGAIGLGLLGGGTAALAGGAALVLVGFSSAGAAVEAGDNAGSWEDWEAAGERYDSARGLVTTGWIVGLAGAGVAAAGGALMTSDGWQVAPVVGRHAIGVTVRRGPPGAHAGGAR